MRTFQILAILAAASLPGGAHAANITCPPIMEVTQSWNKSPEGWTARADTVNKPLVLESMELYDGPPEDMASLKPDNGDSNDSVMVWTLYPSARGYYVECRYTNTTVTLNQELPIAPKECRLFFSKESKVSGMPEVKSMTCK